MQSGMMFVLGTIALATAVGMHAQSGASTLKKVKDYDLSGPPGKRFDYLTIDTDDDYLISAHLAANQTHVIDLHTDKVLATVSDTPGAEGVEYVPEFKKFYTSNAGDNAIGVVDMKQMKVVKKIKTCLGRRRSRVQISAPRPIFSVTYAHLLKAPPRTMGKFGG